VFVALAFFLNDGHRHEPGFPATLHWTEPRVRLSVKKGALKFANANNLDRKSGGQKTVEGR
jgi:hypothetical protein